MANPSIDSLANQLREKRGARGIREAAAEIGISPATLSRVERGNIPDLNTFAKICTWLEIDPADILGIQSRTDFPTSAAVHFRKEQTLDSEAAQALANMILLAHKAIQPS